MAKIETLDFSGSYPSLSFPDVLAHPDQCQMMLNRADHMYFAASGGEVVKTITKQQLVDRQDALGPVWFSRGYQQKPKFWLTLWNAKKDLTIQ